MKEELADWESRVLGELDKAVLEGSGRRLTEDSVRTHPYLAHGPDGRDAPVVEPQRVPGYVAADSRGNAVALPMPPRPMGRP